MHYSGYVVQGQRGPKPFVGETAWQLTQVQTVYGYDIKKITAAPVQAMNIG